MAHLFEWKDEYATGIGEIDLQHKKIFEIINSLFDALNQSRGNEVVGGVIDELVRYADYHFSFEEVHFEQFEFAGAEAHIKEHNDYRRNVAQFVEEGARTDSTLSYRVLDFLEDWWLDHVTGTDRKYVACFQEHGLE